MLFHMRIQPMPNSSLSSLSHSFPPLSTTPATFISTSYLPIYTPLPYNFAFPLLFLMPLTLKVNKEV